jgi:mannose-6-phosphate isomerase-like protein (cupin superfamily)
MKMNTLKAALVVAAGLSSLSVHAPAADAAGKPAKGNAAVLIPAGDVQWSAVPGMAGVQIAPVGGDPSKGPSHFFLKFAGGFAAPLHHHTAEHFVTVVAGTLVLTVDGKEQQLPPGSYFTFAGKKPHTTACAAGPDCVLSMDVRGKWDVVPEESKASAKK